MISILLRPSLRPELIETWESADQDAVTPVKGGVVSTVPTVVSIRCSVIARNGQDRLFLQTWRGCGPEADAAVRRGGVQAGREAGVC